MKIVIFDDDLFFCEDMETMLRAYFASRQAVHHDIFSFAAPSQLVVHLQTQPVDIAFLDISVDEDESFGLRAARTLRQRQESCHIVFVTADGARIHDALGGLIRPSQFLVKPVEQAQVDGLMDDILQTALSRGDRLVVTHGRSEYILNTGEIISIHREDRKAVITCVNRRVEVGESLESIHGRLPEGFLYVDKGVIVNLAQVAEADFAQRKLTLKNGSAIYMSRNARSAVEQALPRFLGRP